MANSSQITVKTGAAIKSAVLRYVGQMAQAEVPLTLDSWSFFEAVADLEDGKKYVLAVVPPDRAAHLSNAGPIISRRFSEDRAIGVYEASLEKLQHMQKYNLITEGQRESLGKEALTSSTRHVG